MGVNVAQLLPQFLSQPFRAPLGEERTEGHRHEEGCHGDGHWPSDDRQHRHHHTGNHHGGEGRRNGVGEEELHRLNVSANYAHQVSRAAAGHIRRSERVELSVNVNSHFRQQSVGQVVRHPRLRPDEKGGDGSQDSQEDQQKGQVPASDHLPHQQRAHHADTDGRSVMDHAQQEGQYEFVSPWV